MARYYNLETGGFFSLDPVRGNITNPITMNGYNYVNHNPVMMVDPDGDLSIRTSVSIRMINIVVSPVPVRITLNHLLKIRKQIKTIVFTNR